MKPVFGVVVVMQKRGIREALAADYHFEQAGFTVFLR